MSDAEEKPTKPTLETAAVPLKKETIRVTLRANPDAATPEASSQGAPAPPAPKPAAPAPTVPLTGAPKPAAPAPTVKLNTPSKPITPGGGAPASPSPTRPLMTPGGNMGTAQLPKATVSLSTTKMPETPTAAKTTEADFEDTDSVQLEEPKSNKIPVALSVAAIIVAAIVFFLEYQSNQLVDSNFQVF